MSDANGASSLSLSSSVIAVVATVVGASYCSDRTTMVKRDASYIYEHKCNFQAVEVDLNSLPLVGGTEVVTVDVNYASVPIIGVFNRALGYVARKYVLRKPSLPAP
jgi:hypothetical protein